MNYEERMRLAELEFENFIQITENWKDYQLQQWMIISDKYKLDYDGTVNINIKRKLFTPKKRKITPNIAK